MAEAIDLEYMRQDLSLDALAHYILQLLLSAETDVLDPSAGDADKMVMMFVVPAEVVIELPVRMDHPGYYPARIKFFEIAIYRGKTQPPELLLHPKPDILRAQIDSSSSRTFRRATLLGVDFRCRPLSIC